MSTPLNIVEATALAKLAEKEVKRCAEEGQKVTAGNHTFDYAVQVDGSLSRGNDTKVTPSFYMDRHLKPLLLKYAAGLGKEEGKRWFESLMSIDGALGAVIQLGSDSVLKSVDPALIALWDAAEKAAKTKFQEVSPKADRAGNTVVVANIERTSERVVVSAKKRGKS
jgi:hypothetical protein